MQKPKTNQPPSSSRKIQEVYEQARAEELPGTPGEDIKVLKGKIDVCREYQNLSSCQACKQSFFCALLEKYVLAKRYPTSPPPTKTT